MKITRSNELKRPSLSSINISVPKGDVDAALPVSKAFTTLEQRGTALLLLLDQYAYNREQLETHRENYKVEKFAEQHAALLAQYRPKITAARRELFAARDALKEAIADATNLARRETDAITKDPEQAAKFEKMFSYVRYDELPRSAERLVAEGSLVAGAALRQLVKNDTSIPDHIREQVQEKLSTMGAQLAEFGQAATKVGADAIAQLLVHEVNVAAWPATMDGRAMLRLSNEVKLDGSPNEIIGPFDRVVPIQDVDGSRLIRDANTPPQAA